MLILMQNEKENRAREAECDATVQAGLLFGFWNAKKYVIPSRFCEGPYDGRSAYADGGCGIPVNAGEARMLS